MKTKLLLVSLLLFAGVTWGQMTEKNTFSISFKNDTIKTEKSSKDNYINIPLKINIIEANTWDKHKLTIEVNESDSNLPKNEYILYENTYNFKDLINEKIITLLIKKDSLETKDRKLILNLKTTYDQKDVNDRNNGENKKIVIIIKPQSKAVNEIDDYKILSYLGTNFDIVEGKTKAQNLFFATNVFIAPIKNKVGFYFSLYGNRTMSDIDSTGSVRRTFKLEYVDPQSHIRHTSQNKLIITRVSDNIGVNISPLFRLIKSSDNNINLYYSPSLEFIWRKSTITRDFKDPINLQTESINTPIPGTIIMDDISRRVQNEYVFNAGIVGLFLVYETKDFSFRVNSSVGYSSYFYPGNSLTYEPENNMGRSNDIFFSGRAWITEATTGLTLQTEVLNTAINPRPFFGVTLSKAFKLDKLGTVFKPLTER